MNINKDSKILFVFAHPDDEILSACGLIMELNKKNIKSDYLCISGSMDINTNDHYSIERLQNTEDFCDEFGVRLLGGLNIEPFTFKSNHLKISYILKNLLSAYDVVFTHSIEDSHEDHKILAEKVYIDSRNSSTSIFQCFNVSSFTSYQPNAFMELVNVSEDELFRTLKKYVNNIDNQAERNCLAKYYMNNSCLFAEPLKVSREILTIL